MMSQMPVLIIVIPLISALIITLIGWFKPKLSWPLTILALFGTTIAAWCSLQQVISHGAQRYFLGNWIPPFGIEYVVDHLNGLVLFMIALVALLVAIFSKQDIEKEMSDKIPHFYSLFILLVTGLLGITITGDAFNLYLSLIHI